MLNEDTTYVTPSDMIALVLKEFFDADVVDAILLDYQDETVNQATLHAIVSECRVWSGD